MFIELWNKIKSICKKRKEAHRFLANVWCGTDSFYIRLPRLDKTLHIARIYCSFLSTRDKAINYTTNSPVNQDDTEIWYQNDTDIHHRMYEQKCLWNSTLDLYISTMSITVMTMLGTTMHNLCDNEWPLKAIIEKFFYCSWAPICIFIYMYFSQFESPVYVGCTFSGRVQPMATVAKFKADWYSQDQCAYLLPVGQAMVFRQHFCTTTFI